MSQEHGDESLVLDTPKKTEAAHKRFEVLKGSPSAFGTYRAYNVVTQGGRRVSEVAEKFDPEAKVAIKDKDDNVLVERPVEEILMVPALQGGS